MGNQHNPSTMDHATLRVATSAATETAPLPRRVLGLLGVLCVLWVGVLLYLFAIRTVAPQSLFMFWLLLSLGPIILALLYRAVKRDLLLPVAQLRDWAHHAAAGNPPARFTADAGGELSALARDINVVTDQLQAQSRHLDDEVRRRTEDFERKTRALEVLYDVTICINASRDLDDLLERFLQTLQEVVDAKAATIRLIGADGEMRMVASRGLPAAVKDREEILATEHCICGEAANNGQVLGPQAIKHCEQTVGLPFFSDTDSLSLIAVPLQYRGRTLGIYNLFVEPNSMAAREDMRDLLSSVGRHMGTAIEKARMDEEAVRLSVIEERTRIAHELHDSLAQSLASLRFQVRVLDETLHQGNESALWQELERIENSLDEAYTELRELIAHFRAPIDERGLVSAIEKQIDRFRTETQIHIFLQKEWGNTRLPADIEMQILRIVQEALANIRKHSDAHNVRVMLRSDNNGNYRVLVEDDGIGMVGEVRGSPGEHVGLSIMEERAKRFGGQLRIESEPGEGTRVMLDFKLQAANSERHAAQ